MEADGADVSREASAPLARGILGCVGAGGGRASCAPGDCAQRPRPAARVRWPPAARAWWLRSATAPSAHARQPASGGPGRRLRPAACARRLRPAATAIGGSRLGAPGRRLRPAPPGRPRPAPSVRRLPASSPPRPLLAPCAPLPLGGGPLSDLRVSSWRVFHVKHPTFFLDTVHRCIYDVYIGYIHYSRFSVVRDAERGGSDRTGARRVGADREEAPWTSSYRTPAASPSTRR